VKFNKKIRRALQKHHPLARNIDSRVRLSWVLKRSAVSNKNWYCYFRIPKCASSTVIRTLASYDPFIPFSEKDSRGSLAKKSFSGLRSARALKLKSFVKKYYLFTFVRNPYTRLLSSYKSKIAGSDSPRYEPARQFILSTSSDRKLSFEGFIRYLESGGLFSDPHWLPQTSMLPVKPGDIDFIGRVETIDKDLEIIINKIFGEGTYKGAAVRTVGRTESSSQTGDYYNTETAARVLILYRQDFDSFGYSHDPALDKP